MWELDYVVSRDLRKRMSPLYRLPRHKPTPSSSRNSRRTNDPLAALERRLDILKLADLHARSAGQDDQSARRQPSAISLRPRSNAGIELPVSGTIGPLRAPVGKVGTSAEFKASSATSKTSASRRLRRSTATPSRVNCLQTLRAHRRRSSPRKPAGCEPTARRPASPAAAEPIRITCCKIRLLFW